jgi:branched-chain amino acid transport system ATP-binding protein
MSAKNLLEVKNITMQFGGLKAVDSLEVHIQKGELMGLISPQTVKSILAVSVLKV